MLLYAEKAKGELKDSSILTRFIAAVYPDSVKKQDGVSQGGQSGPSASGGTDSGKPSIPVSGGAEGGDAPTAPLPDDTKRLVEELIAMLTTAKNEAAELLEALRSGNGTITMLRTQVADRDTQIKRMETTISERDESIAEQRRETARVEQALHDTEARVSDLTERLKVALQADSITQSQELATLKANLHNSLKTEYSDYLEIRDAECNTDNYTALIGSLSNIFKTLRGYGIIAE
jgi:chromosome segregation ATPase